MAQVNDASGRAVFVTILQVDDAGTYKYLGEADSGTATSAAQWSICRVTNASGSILYAAGGQFNQIWDNRTSLSYA